MKESILVVDCGGTNTKILLFDMQGNKLGMYKLSTKRIEKDGMYEMDLVQFQKDIQKGIQEVSSIGPICAATCVGHGKGVYLLDKKGRIFRNAILSMDQRANSLCEKLKEHEDKIQPISHQKIMSGQAPVLLKWLKENEIETYQNIGYVLSCKDFIRYILTGEIYQEIGDASSNNLLNLETKQYDKQLFNFFGINEMFECMPPLAKSEKACGKMRQEFGLGNNIPVYAGLFDVHASALSMGILHTTNIGITAGTWSVNVMVDKNLENKDKNSMTSLYLNDTYLYEASSPTSAGNLDVFMHQWCSELDYTHLNQYLEKVSSKDCHVLFTPFLYGNYGTDHARSSFIGLRSDTSKLEVLQAICEGVVFSHKYHLETLGYEDKDYICLSGGVTYSKSWIQMFANILEKTIYTYQEKELSALGGAILVAYAQKKYPSLQEAFLQMSKKDTVYTPTVEAKFYRQKYAAYKYLLRELSHLWDEI